VRHFEGEISPEERRRQADERLHFQSQILAQLSDAVVAIDGVERILFWGHGAEELYGIAARDALGKRRSEIYEDRFSSPEEERAAHASLAHHQYWRGENVHVLRSGREIHVESRVCVLRDASGRERGLLAVIRDISDRKRIERERAAEEGRLQEAREQLRVLATRLQSIREEEKARIARDLHDELGQHLTALKMDLRSLESAIGATQPTTQGNALLDRVVAASTLVDHTVRTVQRLALELRPGALDRLGLAAALRHEVRRFGRHTGLACRACIPDPLPEVRPEVATALYRICQEAMTNVSRHAQASHVTVRLDVVSDRIVLQIEDDGRGFDPSSVVSPPALGLIGMVERAKALAGDVWFGRGDERGTIVTASIPLARAAEENHR
jgi:PAS domain S-box-containing protein